MTALAVDRRLRVVSTETILRDIAERGGDVDHMPDPFGSRMDDEVVTVHMVAALCRRSRHTVLEWARTGKVPYVRKGSGGIPYTFRVGDVRDALGFTTGTAAPAVPASGDLGAGA